MTETIETPPPPPAPVPGPSPQSNPLSDERQMALVVYILYLLPMGGVTHLVGLVLAYVSRDTAPEWLKSHYTFQIRTFWIGLLYFCVAGLLCFVLIGFPLLVAVTIWFVVRCALGISRLMRSEPYPTPLSWVI
jgi:uncharacterized membrane protein